MNKNMKKESYSDRSGYDRRHEDDRRTLYNVMPLGYDQRKRKIENRSPVEKRFGWNRYTRWGSVGPEEYSPYAKL